MRILYVEPVGHSLFSDHFAMLLRRMSPPILEVDVAHLNLGSLPTSPFLSESPDFQAELLNRIRQAEVDGYDGVIIGCSSDPGLYEARRSVDIPVVGPFAAALHLAALRVERVGIVTPGPQSEVNWLWDCARGYGLDHIVADIVVAEVGHPPEDAHLAQRMREAPGGVRDEILAVHWQSVVPGGVAMVAAAELVKEHNVGAILFACTFWAGMLESIRQILGVTVFDPCATPLKIMETLIDLAPCWKDKEA